jgi:hypothetical protein
MVKLAATMWTYQFFKVLAMRHQHEVFDPIVILLAILVMNVFIMSEYATEMLLHDVPVFENAP